MSFITDRLRAAYQALPSMPTLPRLSMPTLPNTGVATKISQWRNTLAGRIASLPQIPGRCTRGAYNLIANGSDSQNVLARMGAAAVPPVLYRAVDQMLPNSGLATAAKGLLALWTAGRVAKIVFPPATQEQLHENPTVLMEDLADCIGLLQQLHEARTARTEAERQNPLQAATNELTTEQDRQNELNNRIVALLKKVSQSTVTEIHVIDKATDIAKVQEWIYAALEAIITHTQGMDSSDYVSIEDLSHEVASALRGPTNFRVQAPDLRSDNEFTLLKNRITRLLGSNNNAQRFGRRPALWQSNAAEAPKDNAVLLHHEAQALQGRVTRIGHPDVYYDLHGRGNNLLIRAVDAFGRALTAVRGIPVAE